MEHGRGIGRALWRLRVSAGKKDNGMIQRQPKPRNWCNCMATIRKLRIEQRSAKDAGDERHEARISDEIAGIDYAHETGRCRYEYDADEREMPND